MNLVHDCVEGGDLALDQSVVEAEDRVKEGGVLGEEPLGNERDENLVVLVVGVDGLQMLLPEQKGG